MSGERLEVGDVLVDEQGVPRLKVVAVGRALATVRPIVGGGVSPDESSERLVDASSPTPDGLRVSRNRVERQSGSVRRGGELTLVVNDEVDSEDSVG